MLGVGFSSDTSVQLNSMFYLASAGDNSGQITADPVPVSRRP
jgi:hypothetical protein